MHQNNACNGTIKFAFHLTHNSSDRKSKHVLCVGYFYYSSYYCHISSKPKPNDSIKIRRNDLNHSNCTQTEYGTQSQITKRNVTFFDVDSCHHITKVNNFHTTPVQVRIPILFFIRFAKKTERFPCVSLQHDVCSSNQAGSRIR